TPLHLACANGHVDVVTYLVKNKCKLNLFDNYHRSPLMKAVQCQQEKCVAVLLKHGADPNLADADGNTALHLAVISPNTSVAGLLLEHNANIDAQNKEGHTPLILAVSKHHEEIVEFLLKNGADVNACDQCERTPLMTAASDGELNLIKVLLRYGADVSHRDTNGWSAEDLAVICGYSSVSKELAEYADCEDTGEASAGGAQGAMVLSTPHWARFMLAIPAVDRGDSEMTEWKKEIPQPLSDSCGLKEKKPSFDDSFESSNKSWSAAKNPRLESRRPNSVILEHVDEDPEEERYEAVDSKVGKVLKQGSGNSYLNRPKGNLRAAFHLSAEEESLELEEEEEKQEKKDAGEELQTAGVEGVKKSVCNGSRQVHNASKDDAGALPEAGPEEEEDAGSPWDSELKTPESVLEMGETSPKKRRQESDEYSGSTFPTSSSAEKDDIKDAIENCGVQ
ncbi:PREDICTED: ankyrin repeat domain-containing protein 20B-like, partial [Leptosomus discolor]|uniref:ankyrin repeat domain-containing protein 20B-like n=1 Tax=Leptosomus discolor TaxID=188344 RepID=UPI000522C3B1